MSPEEIQALANLPVMGVLIYLIVRMQSEKEKLISTIMEMEREHTRLLVEIMCKGKEGLKEDIIANFPLNCSETD